MSYQDYSSDSSYSAGRRHTHRAGRRDREEDLHGLCRRTLRRANEAMTPSSRRHWMIFGAGVLVGLILG
ncbi:hypothetical protein [Denitrobaculum tricleocarpae]|uniref:Uncharacterized protein n=1 Tax=Denitrobaculum tricleocarpae TaxID=2591009 RepID=A0A545TMB0_9PROT|nr:hypothetical protein [Denitrobaculum tricleocarpae]TQV78369.1 hypothetical protein FKG95_17530 [Denitrobaculum tricleocarpae]